MLISNQHSGFVIGYGGELNQSGNSAEGHGRWLQGDHGGSQRVVMEGVVEGHERWSQRVAEDSHGGW